MSLAEQQGIISRLSSVPLLTPTPGVKPADEEEELRKAYSKIREGAYRVVEPGLEDVFLTTLSAAALYKGQLALIKNELRKIMMDAQFAVSSRDNRTLATRIIRWKAWYEVPGHEEDFIDPARSR